MPVPQVASGGRDTRQPIKNRVLKTTPGQNTHVGQQAVIWKLPKLRPGQELGALNIMRKIDGRGVDALEAQGLGNHAARHNAAAGDHQHPVKMPMELGQKDINQMIYIVPT